MLYKISSIFFISILLSSCSAYLQNQVEHKKTIGKETIDIHSAENSLDWEGIYSGVFPCDDCKGVKTTLLLGYQGNAKLEEVYLGSKTQSSTIFEGKFSWDKQKPLIYLDKENDTRAYFIAEGYILVYNRKTPLTKDKVIGRLEKSK